MAMDFMAQPAQSVNKGNRKQGIRNRKRICLINYLSPVLCFVFSAFCFSQCSPGHSGDAVLKKYTLRSTDTALTSRGGIVKYKDTAVSGELIVLYPSGEISLFAEYKEGKENGLYKQWYEEGGLAEQRMYIAGRKEGVHYGWWPDGKRKFEYHFKDDKYEGTATEWMPSGKIYKSFTYKNGQEEGLQQVWKADGTLRTRAA